MEEKTRDWLGGSSRTCQFDLEEKSGTGTAGTELVDDVEDRFEAFGDELFQW